MRPIATDVARSVVCLSVCLSDCLSGTRVSNAKAAEPIEMPFGEGLTTWVQGTTHLMEFTSPTERGTFEGGHVPVHCNVPTHGCIAHCSSAAAGECACQRTRRTNAFAAARRRCDLLPNYFGHMLMMLFRVDA